MNPERKDRLPRRLGLWSAIGLQVGLCIGSGIFRMPSVVAAETGSSGASLICWGLGGVLSLLGALTLAELAGLFPRTGGVYVYLREIYGPLPAFLYGWVWLLVNPAAWAAVALVFASYLQSFVALTDHQARMAAVALISTVAAIHFRSVRLGAAIQNASTVAKLLALALLIGVTFLLGHRDAGALATAPIWGPKSWAGSGIAIVSVLFASGFCEELTAMAGEIGDPARTLPRAIIVSMGVVTLAYLLTNLAFLYALPLPEMAASRSVAVDAMDRVVGRAGASAAGALVMLSTFGSLNGSAMSDPRVFFAMADDGLFFRCIAAVHPRHRTPHAAILMTAVLAILYVSSRSFEQLAETFVLGLWPFVALAVFGVFIVRRSRPDLRVSYRTIGYPLVPSVFVAASLILMLNAIGTQSSSTLFSLAITLLGIPVYFCWRAWDRR